MHDVSVPLQQGATWMYEAVVGPLFSRILNEAVKIPAVDRMVNQTESVRTQLDRTKATPSYHMSSVSSSPCLPFPLCAAPMLSVDVPCKTPWEIPLSLLDPM